MTRISYLFHLLKWGCISTLAGAAMASCAGGYLWILGGQTPIWTEVKARQQQSPAGVRITVKPGMSLTELAAHMASQGCTISPHLITLYIKLFSHFEKAKSGTYRLAATDSLRTTMHKIIAGDTTDDLAFRITIPEGYTLRQIAARMIAQRNQLADGAGLSMDSLLTQMQAQPYIQTLGITASSLEGYLYPETYEFYGQPPTSNAVIKRMTAQLFTLIDPAITQGLQRRGISLHQGLIMASLIEKETAIAAEKPFIAEVIWNRLQRKMPLGIDAAIIYGIPDYRGNITTAHLQDDTNLYNTRIHRGLPPSPIGSPTISSLRAVIEPSNLGYLYYVLMAHRGGRHHFSKTYREHRRHVARLIQAGGSRPASSP